MEEKTTMADFAEELEASYKAAEAAAADDTEELAPEWATVKNYMDEKTVLTVKVGGIVKGGVIANVEGIRGFIPASRLSLDHVEDLNTFLGQKIKVRVITVEPDKKRLVMSARELLRDEARAAKDQARKEAMDQVKVGDVLEGTVETLKDYGAFIRLANGLSGLVHVSQISDKRVTSPAKVLKEGEAVTVKVIDIKDGRLSLSIRALIVKEEEDKAPEEEKVVIPKCENIGTSLGSLLAGIKLD